MVVGGSPPPLSLLTTLLTAILVPTNRSPPTPISLLATRWANRIIGMPGPRSNRFRFPGGEGGRFGATRTGDDNFGCRSKPSRATSGQTSMRTTTTRGDVVVGGATPH